MKFLSVGSNCCPKFYIDKYYEKIETHFFDYTYEDFECIIYVLQNIDIPLNVLNSNDFVCIQNNIAHTKIKFVSAHDKPHNEPFETYLPLFIEKYTARLNKLKTIILENDDITFLHYISPESLTSYKLHPVASDIPTIEQIQRFFECVKNINLNTKCILKFLIPPSIMHLHSKIQLLENIENVNIFYMTSDNTPSDWSMSNLNWSEAF